MTGGERLGCACTVEVADGEMSHNQALARLFIDFEETLLKLAGAA